MKKTIILLFGLLAASSSFAAETKPKIDWDVKTVMSTEPLEGNVHSGLRYRAIIASSVKAETPTYLIVEKTKEPSAPGNPYTLVWSKRVRIPELEKLNDIKISETGYMGDFTSLNWSGRSFSFSVPARKKTLKCLIKDIETLELTATCL